jgi:hypothetical protein
MFYMNEQQWEAVQAEVNATSNRPRQYESWFEVQKACFLAVWRIIFPRDDFPRLREPPSPCESLTRLDRPMLNNEH